MPKRNLMTTEQIPEVSSFAKKADYKEQQNPEYQGNALIEALPLPLSPEELKRQLAYYPKFDERFQLLPPEERIDMIDNISQVFQPMDEHLQLYYRLFRALRGGYVGRSLFDVLTIEHVRELVAQNKDNIQGQPLAKGFYIIGLTRMGKTTSAERILRMVDPVIWHSIYQGRIIMRAQVPWLKLECPHDGSTKGLCLQYFARLDRLLHSNYYAAFGDNGRASTNQMQIYMAFLSDLLKLGILVIDELERLSQAKSGGADEMLDFFVTLSNLMRVPVVLIGTYEAFGIFKSRFKHVCRGVRQGNVIWTNMQQNGKSWNSLLNGIWKYQYVRKPAQLTPELNDALYYVSQGITELAIVAFTLAQERAILSKKEEITPDIIYSVAADSMQAVFEGVDALRKNDASKLQEYRDLELPIELQDPYTQHKQSPKNDVEKPGQVDRPNRQKSDQNRRSTKPSQNPHIIPSDGDLRLSLVEDENQELGTYEALKATGKIPSAEEIVPRESRE